MGPNQPAHGVEKPNREGPSFSGIAGVRLPYSAGGRYTKIFNEQTRALVAGAKEALGPELALDYLAKVDGEPIPTVEYARLHAFAVEKASSYQGPVLAYALDTVDATLRFFASLEDDGAEVLMAAKSMTPGPVFERAARALSGFDVSNEREYEKLPSALQGKTVFVTSPVLPGDLASFSRKGNSVFVTLDAPRHHRALAERAGHVEYCIRLNPSSILNQDSRFGVSPTAIDVLRRMSECGSHVFSGFHMHSGWSTDNTPAAYLAMARAAVCAAESIGKELRVLNLGGGLSFLSPRELRALVAALKSELPKATRLFFEPGRPITEKAGFAMGRVLEVATNGDVTDFTLDLSFEAHLRWTDPMLLVEASSGERAAAPSRVPRSRTRIRVFGPTCAESDLLGTYEVPSCDDGRAPFAVGDLMLFGDVVGYSACWNVEFNGWPAAEIAYFDGGAGL